MNDLMIAILAAGASARMRGADKLLAPVGEMPLLRRVALTALELGCPVIVTLPPDRPLRHAALAGLDLRLLEIADAAEGMAASFRGVARAAGHASGVMTLLGDMPELDAADLQTVRAAWDGTGVVRGASIDGVPGQPVILPRHLFPALAALTGDTGGRSVLAGEDVRLIPLPDQRAVTDLDTPEDWAAWRARTGCRT